ncbi:MAG: hypothetical protein ACR2JX_05825 [Mycobacteriales bacterium]
MSVGRGDHANVSVVDEDFHSGAFVYAADSDVMKPAVVAQGD